ncbi:DUF393 domain-containing protein [bacterium]|nr:DUF393 domain-containing protein [bacterium]
MAKARMASWLQGWFGIDIRSLAAFRIALGLMHLAFILSLLPDIAVFYTDLGAIPRSTVLTLAGDWQINLHFFNGLSLFQGLLFALHGLCALALTIGYRSRIMTFICWLLLISAVNRAPPIMQGSDVLLMCLTFWAVFLPLGVKWGVDAALNTARNTVPGRITSTATAAILLQACYVYFIGALLKNHPVWHKGNAVGAALHIEAFSLLGGHWLRQFPTLCHYLTYMVYCLELFAPLGLLNRAHQLRLLYLAMLACMHIAFALTLGVGNFPYVSLTSLLLFLPAEWWNYLGRKLASPARMGVTLYYDEACTFCKKTCELLREFLLPGNTPIIPAQSKKRIHNLMVKHHSWVVEDHEGKPHFRWEAMIYIIGLSPLFGWVSQVLSLGRLLTWGDRLYGLIGDSRSRLGTWTSSLLPYRRLNLHTGWFLQAIIAALAILTGWVNLATLYPKNMPLVENVKPFSSALRLDQRWNMFSPYPLTNSGWLVIEGTLEDGRPIDAWHGTMGKPSFAEPTIIANWYPDFRWRKYVTQMYNEGTFKPYRPYFEGWLCQRWNRAHPNEPLASLQVHAMWIDSYATGPARTVNKMSMPIAYCMAARRN